MSDAQIRQLLAALADQVGPGQVMAGLPLCAAMKIEFVEAKEGSAFLRLPYSEELIGERETGVISGGAVTALLDTCCGSAVISAAMNIASTATLDLRIDYMRPATPGLALIAHAQVYRTTRTIAFVRALAYHDDPDKPVASASASFMLERKAEAETDE